jgi:N-methylhydantoinase A
VNVPKYTPQALPARPSSPPQSAAAKSTRSVFFTEAIETAIYDRAQLDVGVTFAGPAIVEQFDATTVVPPGWRAFVDRHSNLILEQGD